MEILFGVVFTKFVVYFGEELATFNYVVGVFLARKFKRALSLFKEFFNWSAKESKTFSLSDQSLQERVLQVSPWRVRAEGQNGRLGRQCVVFSGCRKKATIIKNEVISINQLNYNANEKSHVTEEFASKTTRH